jgi:hypothetical protein
MDAHHIVMLASSQMTSGIIIISFTSCEQAARNWFDARPSQSS